MDFDRDRIFYFRVISILCIFAHIKIDNITFDADTYWNIHKSNANRWVLVLGFVVTDVVMGAWHDGHIICLLFGPKLLVGVNEVIITENIEKNNNYDLINILVATKWLEHVKWIRFGCIWTLNDVIEKHLEDFGQYDI